MNSTTRTASSTPRYVRRYVSCAPAERNTVTHAGEDFQNSGHHHLLIDVNEPLEANEPIPQDKNHVHFGAGQTEARIELPPGKHTLQLVLGDAKHYPFSPPLVSEKIQVTIK